jgi:hypothetical protein
LEFSIPYLVVTAYLSIATSHHSFTLVLLSDILSILQMDGAMSSARCESKRLKTRMLAEQKNISKSGTSTRWRTYLGHPYHL